MIFIKKHAAEHGIILAMCDEELMGKVLKAGKLVLDLDKYASFYNGELVSDEQAFGMVESRGAVHGQRGGREVHGHNGQEGDSVQGRHQENRKGALRAGLQARRYDS